MALGVLLPSGYEVLEDNNGATVPAPGGLVWPYAAGTTTPQSVYQDPALTILHPFPIAPGPSGVWAAYVPAGASYKLVFETAPIPPSNHGATIKTLDNVSGPIFSGQLQFPAVAVPSSDPNVLDDYEEGTWTPVLTSDGGASGQVYTQQQGVYVKVGRVVSVSFGVTTSNKGVLSGNLQVTGLPFAAGPHLVAAVGFFGGLAVPVSQMALTQSTGGVSPYITAILSPATVAVAILDTSHITTTFDVRATLTYKAVT
jgi:hypothetical protein